MIQTLEAKKLISPPKWLASNVGYLTIMGSYAYGVSADDSDFDVYGFGIPPKEIIFPHLAGEIFGFGTQNKRFDQYQQHHVFDQNALGGKGRDYDLTVFSIVKYFQLLMDNNPNIIDSIFTPVNCILHATKVGHMVRDNRKLFLHKGAFHKFKGYAYSQLHKTDNRTDNKVLLAVWAFEKEHGLSHDATFAQCEAELARPVGLTADQAVKYHGLYAALIAQSVRYEKIKIEGTDRKFLYHVVRLMDEAEQILREGDVDLTRNREQLKAIRRGDMTEEDVRSLFASKERELESLYHSSPLRHGPDEPKIKALLVNCLEEHYGDLSACIVEPDKYLQAMREVRAVLDKAGV